jgi:hypothetical protein
MATYRVVANDNPETIAAKLHHPGQAAALIRANPQKATSGGTWRSLHVNELIAVPASWTQQQQQQQGLGRAHGLGDPMSDGTAQAVAALGSAICQAGSPTVMAFQTSWNSANPSATPLVVDGKYGPATQAALASTLGSSGTAPAACTTYSAASYSQADMVNFANAIGTDTTICNGTPNSNVSNFQTAYNQVNNATLSVDGKYGPATFAAMNGLVSSGLIAASSVPQPCAIYGGTGSGGSGGSGGGSTNVPPITIVGSTPAPASTGSTVLFLAVLGVAAVGTYMYMNKHHAPKMAHARTRFRRLRRR